MPFAKRWFAVSFLLASTPAAAAMFTVTRADDPAPNGCLADDCSLREALDATVATPGADTIVLEAGQYTVTRDVLTVIGEVSIEGEGPDATRIVGTGAFDLLGVAPLGKLTLDGVTLASQDAALDVDSATAILRNVRVPAGGGIVGGGSDNGAANLVVERSELGDPLGCECGAGSVRVVDSTLNSVLVFNGSADLRLDRVEVAGPTPIYGVAFATAGTATIRDSTIRKQAMPLVLGGDGGRVDVARTRFIDNTGPISSTRQGTVRMQDIEFRDNVVGAATDAPSVLIAKAGTVWRITRALFVGNRGDGGSGPNLIGATVRVLSGGNIAIANSTFYDNTFRSDVANGVGNAIGVDAQGDPTTVAWLFHVTMRPGPFVPDDAIASLIAARGASANVRVYNSVMNGTCAFASGAAMFQAEGNIESPGHSCQFPDAGNDNDVALIDLGLAPIADNGGFTQSILPTRNSPAIDRGVSNWCTLANIFFGSLTPLDQRRYLRPADGMGCDSGATETQALSDSIFDDDFDLRIPMALHGASNRE